MNCIKYSLKLYKSMKNGKNYHLKNFKFVKEDLFNKNYNYC